LRELGDALEHCGLERRRLEARSEAQLLEPFSGAVADEQTRTERVGERDRGRERND
jgi:hypothetical protein